MKTTREQHWLFCKTMQSLPFVGVCVITALSLCFKKKKVHSPFGNTYGVFTNEMIPSGFALKQPTVGINEARWASLIIIEAWWWVYESTFYLSLYILCWKCVIKKKKNFWRPLASTTKISSTSPLL